MRIFEKLTEGYEEYGDVFGMNDTSKSDMYDIEDDGNVYELTDTRKPKVTFKIINKLRKYRELKKRDLEMRDAVVSAVYGITDTQPSE